jgi:CBS domain-containing protein
MAAVRKVLREKGSHVLTIGPDATVLDAALLMNEHHVGALVVLDEGELSGIVTERDVLRKIVAQRQDPAVTRVCEIMTTRVICCQPDMPIDQARSLFRQRRIRHLPVIDDDGTLMGVISIGDLNAHDLDGQAVQIHYLEQYLYGSVW